MITRLLTLLAFAGSLACHGQSEIYFLPPEPKASVSFEGVTQEGRDIHRLEVRRLAYREQPSKKELQTIHSYVIYYAGADYGPKILRQADAIDPLVLRVSKDIVEIYFLAGAHTHIRQRWKLLGYTARLEKETEIDWQDDPREKREKRTLAPNATLPRPK